MAVSLTLSFSPLPKVKTVSSSSRSEGELSILYILFLLLLYLDPPEVLLLMKIFGEEGLFIIVESPLCSEGLVIELFRSSNLIDLLRS